MGREPYQTNLFYASGHNFSRYLWLTFSLLAATYLGWLIAGTGLSIAGILISLPFIIGFLVLVFLFPKLGLIIFIIYSFMISGLGRQFTGPQFGMGDDAILILTWLGVIFYRTNKYRFRHLNNDLVWLAVVWFIITLLELGNPEHPDFQGWLQEMRSTTLYWILAVPLAFMVFNKKSDIFLFLDIIIILSLIGALWGIKQLYIGVSAAEHRWLEAGAKRTHILFGKLRVFSYYTEAAQFGASQAQLAVMCLILAIGPHSSKRKIFYAIAGIFIFYGMLISGTRGALGGRVGGGFIYLVLSKNIKILVLGGIVGICFIGMLKFTSIGNGNDQIRRLRSAMNPNDPSLQVRLVNQRTLANSLASKPFGTGVGTIGMWGVTYNKHIYTAKIPPDSYFVKVWAMYGVIGFIIWFGMMLYILGKAAGITWRTRDPALRNQLCSLCAGYAAILTCSYGNEIINTLPSSAIVYVSWAFIWMSTRWDTPPPKLVLA
jgi:VanZ family protein